MQATGQRKEHQEQRSTASRPLPPRVPPVILGALVAALPPQHALVLVRAAAAQARGLAAAAAAPDATLAPARGLSRLRWRPMVCDCVILPSETSQEQMYTYLVYPVV